MGIFRRIVQGARKGFPVLRRVGQAVKSVVVGASEAKPVNRTVEAAVGLPFLAVIRKAVAAIVGYVTGTLLVNWFGLDIGFLSPELTELLVSILVGAYLTWRVPNAEPAR